MVNSNFSSIADKKYMGVQVFQIIRKKLKWSRYRMAKELKMSQSAYDHIEQRAQNVSVRSLQKLQQLAQARLEMDLAEFWDLAQLD